MFRYFKKQETESKQTQHLGTDVILRALSERLLKDFNLASAMEKLKWEGLVDLNEERIDGLSNMLEQLRELKTSLLQTYTLDHILESEKESLRRIFQSELESKEAQRSATKPDLENNRPDYHKGKVAELLHWVESDFPKNLAEMFYELRNAFPEENPAIQALHNINNDIWRKISGINFLINDTNIIDNEELVQGIDGLQELITSIEERKNVDADSYISKYDCIFEFDTNLEEWIDSIVTQRTVLKKFMSSVPFLMRMSLEEFISFNSKTNPLACALEALWDVLDQRMPNRRLNKYEFSGTRRLNLDSALLLVERLHKLDQLENTILSVNIQGDLSKISHDLIREVLGELAENSFQKIEQIVNTLSDGGFLHKGEEGYLLTSKAFRRIGELALSDIFSNFNWSKSNKLTNRSNSSIHSFTGQAKEYEYGDILSLNLSSTMFNALRRGPINRLPIAISPLDFEVYQPEYITKNSTVLLVDMSSSMEEKFAKAKKVALALQQLIKIYFPGDALNLVGFYSLARPIKIADLFELKTVPFNPGHFPKVISHNELKKMEKRGKHDFPGDFTNIQEGLRVAREILLRAKNDEKHIILITDGEPTACIKAGIVYLESSPTSAILEETLKEVRRCTRNGINMTTFMLSEDKSLENFVKVMGKISRGKAFFTPSEEIDQCV
ncbi:MAG: VWA domain-containing protein, partial [Desulfobacterales bacterium]